MSDRSTFDTAIRSEFGDHLREMKANWKIIAAVSAAVTAVAVLLALGQSAVYQARTTLRVADPAVLDSDAADYLAEQSAELAVTQVAHRAAGDASGLGIDAEEVADRVVVSLVDTPGFVRVTATGPDESAAVALAGAVADVMVAGGDERNSPVEIVDPARSTGAVGSSPLTTGLLAALASALLAAEGVIALRKLRGRLSPVAPERDVERILEIPATAYRPQTSDALMSFYAEQLEQRPIVTVVQRGEQADASVAARLGTVAGRFHRRVLMVDADVNGASLHEHFAVPRSPGLAEVLEGSSALRDTIRRVDPENSTALLPAGRAEVDAVAGRARTEATHQVVVNAGADAAIVSVTAGSSHDDSLMCVNEFPDAVVLVVDPDDVVVAELRRLADQIRAVGGRLVGVVTAPSPTAPPSVAPAVGAAAATAR